MRTAYIGLGANLPRPAGSPADTLAAAAMRLESLGRITGRSSLYETAPVGLAEQPRFLNAVVGLETELEPRLLLKELLAVEKEFGRDRSQGTTNGPRTLDLDILLVDDLAIGESGLQLPHPRLAEREFVLMPLSEVAPQVRIPGSNKTVLELLEALRRREKGEPDAVVRMEDDRWGPATLP